MIERVRVTRLAPLLEWLRLHPLPLLSLCLSSVGPLPQPEDVEYLHAVEELELGPDFPLEDLRQLSHLPQLHPLKRLKAVAAHHFDDESVEILLETEWLHGLQELTLAMCNLSPHAMQRLATSPQLADLHVLDVSYNPAVGDRGVSALLRAPTWTQLRKLNLYQTGMSGRGVRSMAGFPGLASLRELGLAYNDLGGTGIAALLASPHLAGLQALDLSGTRLGRRGYDALCSATHLHALEILELGDCDLDSERLRQLFAANSFRGLRWLIAGSNRLGPTGARVLAQHCPWPLTQLDLRINALGDTGIEALCDTDRLAQLYSLIVYINAIGPAGASALAQCPHWPRLRRLGLRNNEIDSRGAAALAESSTLNLTALELETNPLTAEDAQRLRDRFGGCVSVHP
jgi:Ran GTPase-activating protein (RanGAP) involved in mRNA processing and transport